MLVLKILVVFAPNPMGSVYVRVVAFLLPVAIAIPRLFFD